jgi:hypothetical protein
MRFPRFEAEAGMPGFKHGAKILAKPNSKEKTFNISTVHAAASNRVKGFAR